MSEIGGTIGLDGDTRRICNHPDCDKDWPCPIHKDMNEGAKTTVPRSAPTPDDVILHAYRNEGHWYVDVDKRLNQSGIANGATLYEALRIAVTMALENRKFRREQVKELLDTSADGVDTMSELRQAVQAYLDCHKDPDQQSLRRRVVEALEKL